MSCGRCIRIILAGADPKDESGMVETMFDAVSELAFDLCPDGVDAAVFGGPMDEDWNPV